MLAARLRISACHRRWGSLFAIDSCSPSIANADSPPTPIFPKALAPGDTIMFVAPAKYLDKGRVALAEEAARGDGLQGALPEEPVSQEGLSRAAPTKSVRPN